MQETDYRELREKVEKQVERQKGIVRGVFFGVSALLFVLFNVIGWSMISGVVSSLAEGQAGAIVGGGIMLSVGWLLSLMYQGFNLFLETRAGERTLRNQAAQQVLAREQLARIDAIFNEESQKQKRDDIAYRLTDDGEIQPLEQTAEAEEPRRARQ